MTATMPKPAEAPARRRRGQSMPADQMHQLYPSLRVLTQPTSKASQAAWVAVFNARPDAMAALLGDFIKQVHAQPGRIGQRPMPREEQVDFESLVYAEENDLPLAEVLPKLVKVSERMFAMRIGMSRTSTQRLLSGQYEPDVREMRAIARAVGKSPLYFVEYRKAMAVAAFVNLIDERPGIAMTLYRRYLEVRIND